MIFLLFLLICKNLEKFLDIDLEFLFKLTDIFSLLKTISNNKPIDSSIDASPNIKKVKPKQLISSIVLPTIPAKKYKTIQTISDKTIKLKKLLFKIINDVITNQKDKLANDNQVNIKKIKDYNYSSEEDVSINDSSSLNGL